jgi:hypothetical protein
MMSARNTGPGGQINVALIRAIVPANVIYYQTESYRNLCVFHFFSLSVMFIFIHYNIRNILFQ